jgi:gliding motility-associated-like protein
MNAQGISGVINRYAKVDSIAALDKVRLDNVSYFKPGDTVLIIQMKGANFDKSSGLIKNMNGAGKYEFVVISSIETATRIVVLSSNLINRGKYDAKEGLQMVRVPTYDSVTVKSGGLTCDAWDGSKGGVVALFVNKTLTLDDSIYADRKGFSGGNYTQNNGICPILGGNYYYTADKIDSAGLKGDGIVSTSFTYKRGQGKNANGGGGGYGKYAGGGGGGNYGKGGRGGKMDESCVDPDVSLGSGGEYGYIDPSYFIGDTAVEFKDRVFMGGGGGAGTGYLTGGSNGGTGGGIIFIRAQNVLANNRLISALGEGIEATDVAGSGGGGAGGSVLLDVNNFSASVKISVRGGNGGGTVSASGQGGGGGGGFVWFSHSALGYPKPDTSRSMAGGTTLSGTVDITADGGGFGGTASNLIPVYNGFLCNSIFSSQTICYGGIADTIKGSNPNGGDGNYKYQWQKRKYNTSAWINIAGANSRDYRPMALFDSTEFRRVVKAYSPKLKDSITDLGKYIIVNVLSEIKNNTIDADTAVCYGLPQVVLRGKIPAGGDGSFSYRWESNNGTSGWVIGSGTYNGQNYAASNTKTQFYRRVVLSNICSAVSDVDTVIVYSKIAGNGIGTSQMICYNSSPNSLSGLNTLSGGDSNYIYKWEQKESTSGSWLSTTGTLKSYSPGKLITETNYRRIVSSGLNNTCKDTSNIVAIKITSAIDHSSNTITASQTKCQNVVPDVFTGSLPYSYPAGGNSIPKYQWEKSTNKTSWDSITTSTTLQNYGHAALATTTYFRRIVRWGELDCCKDTSANVTITVQPSINNNIIKSGQEICQNQKPDSLKQFSGTVGGGNGLVYNYTWQEKNASATSWSSASGTYTTKNYQPAVLTETKYYRRMVVSGACTNYSDSLKINVLLSLVGNTISGNHDVCRDLPADNLIGGSMINGAGTYRYSWQDSIPGGSWNAVASTESTYAPGVLLNSKYFRRIVKSGTNDCCISKSDPFLIYINELPVGYMVAMDTAICEGNTLNARAVIANIGTGPFDLTLKGSGQFNFTGINAGTNLLNIKPVLINDTLHIETIRDAKGCLAKTKTGLAKIRLVTVPEANAGTDNSVCGLQYQLKAQPTVGSGLWVLKTGDATFSPSSSKADATVTYSSYGTHKILWRETNEFCSDSAEISLTFYEQPQKPYLGKDTSVYYAFDYSLVAPVPLVGSGLWTSSVSGILISPDDNPTAHSSNMVFGNNDFIWTVTNGACIPVSDTLVVFVDDIKRYTGFSPNGDKVNDQFIVEGLDNAAQKKIKILNRWGSIVYSSDNYDNRWNGTNNNGYVLPDDTYFYVLTVDDGREYKGYIVLKR